MGNMGRGKLLAVIFGVSLLFFSTLTVSCKSDDVPPPEEKEEVVPPEITPEEEPTPVEEPVVMEEPEEEIIEISEEEEEYLRSTNNLDETTIVTKEEFNEDKATILKIISELQVVMDTKDSKKWLNYLDPESIHYYSNPVNLRNAQKKLPSKYVKLNNISDYFYYVFIPSRKRSQVDEIRYISKTNIKAVQVREDYTTVVYYYFTKINGKWLVHLPPV